MTGQSDIDNVRDATDLVRLIGEHVALRPKGREHVGLCPFHDDKNPSLAVVTHKGNAFYKCHACGAGGDAFDFVKTYHRMEFGEALRFLADRAGITLQPFKRAGAQTAEGDGSSKRTDLKKANAFASTYFRRVLADPNLGDAARQVIAQRNISDEMVEAFMIGAAPDQWDGLLNRIRKQSLSEDVFLAAGLLKPRAESDGRYDAFRNRLIFPICDELGNPIAFGARKINPEDEPKYLNSAESAIFSKSKTLYGLNRAKRAIIESKQAIVTEGYTDVIACHQAGICNVVGTLGTALTRDHARLLSRLCDTVVLVFDGDEAGQKAADRALEVFFAEPVDIKICVLPDELDPDELLKQSAGIDRFNTAVAASVDAMQFKLTRFQSQLEGAAGLSARQRRLEFFLAELSNLGFGSMQGVRKSLILSRLAELLNVPIGQIEQHLQRTRPQRQAQPAAVISTDANLESNVSRSRKLAEHELLGILVYEPSAGISISNSADQSALEVNSFLDPDARAVAEIVLPLLLTKSPFTVQQLLAQLSTDHQRSFASSLWFVGERLVENAPEGPRQALAVALQTLEKCNMCDEFEESSQTYRTSPVGDRRFNDLEIILNKRRSIGSMAGAIARERK